MVWLWVYVGFAGLAVVAVFAFVVFGGDFGDHDDDGYYEVEQRTVNQAVAQSCNDMMAAGREIKVFSSPAEGADALRRFVTVGRGIPEAIDTVDDANGSAMRWRADWVVLLDALGSYADELEADPTAEFDPPENSDGDSLIYDLAWVSDVPCELPPVIVALDPDAADLY